MNEELCPICGNLIDSLFWLTEIEVIGKNFESTLRVEKVCTDHFLSGLRFADRQYEKDLIKLNLILETGAMG